MKTLLFTLNNPNHVTFFDVQGVCQNVCQVVRRPNGFLITGGYFANGREVIAANEVLEVVETFNEAISLVEKCCGGKVDSSSFQKLGNLPID